MSVVIRYLPRHLADHLLTRGAAMVVVGVVVLLPLLLGAQGGAFEGRQLTGLFEGAVGNITVFLTLIATYGIVGQDARLGYYRFLHSKPLSPPVYYGASFGVAYVGFLASVLVLTAVFSIVRGPVWPGSRSFAEWTLAFALLGSLVFAFSRFSRLDWVFALALSILAEVARQRWPPGASVRGDVLNVVLPPVGKDAFAPTGEPLWGHVAWMAGYAALMVALGLLAVRYVPPGERR